MQRIAAVVRISACLAALLSSGCKPKIETQNRQGSISAPEEKQIKHGAEPKSPDQEIVFDLQRAALSMSNPINDRSLPTLPSENNYALVRSALESHVDEGALAKRAVEGKDPDERRAAGEKLNLTSRSDKTAFRKIAVEAKDSFVRWYAAKLLDGSMDSKLGPYEMQKANDPARLIRIVCGDRDKNSTQRATALLRISNDDLTLALACGDPDITVRTTAIFLLRNQPELKRLALNDPIPQVREAAVASIEDESFLLHQAKEDSSPSVRLAIVRSLRTTGAILTAATQSYYQPVRDAAKDRVSKEGKEKVLTAHQRIKMQARAVASAPKTTLVERAVHGEFDVVCRAAANRISDPSSLKRIAVESTDREVAKIALSKLSDPAVLKQIAEYSGTIDSAVRLAASCKIGRQNWDEVVEAATKDPKALGDAVAAISLLGTAQKEAGAAARKACVTLIEAGDTARIPELVDLLELYGNKGLAFTYLNCGHPELQTAGRAWGERRGYTIETVVGSRNVEWGSRRSK